MSRACRQSHSLALVAILVGFVGSSSAQDPDTTASPPVDSRDLRLELEDDELAIEYIAHACFRIHSPEGRRILIDPFASRVWLGYDFPGALPVDAIAITHPHYDHDAGLFLGRRFPWGEDVPVFRSGEHTVGDVELTGVVGRHAEPYGEEFGRTNTIWCVDVAGMRIVHLGDNGPLTPENVETIGEVDVLMIPIDGEEHLLKNAEIERIRKQLRPTVLIPMHYRIPQLETRADRPTDLGPIDPWLTGREHTRHQGNLLKLAYPTLPDAPQVIVLSHSPLVSRPKPTQRESKDK